MQEQTTDEGFARVRQQLTEIDESTGGEQLVAMAKKAAINAIDQHTRLIAGVKSLLIQPEVLRKTTVESLSLFMSIWSVAINETLALIRRQYEQLEAQKNQLTAESLTREQQLRTEFEQTTAEREYERDEGSVSSHRWSSSRALWQQRFDEECNRLREQMSKLQTDSDEQLRSLSQRLQSISGENNDYLQVRKKLFFLLLESVRCRVEMDGSSEWIHSEDQRSHRPVEWLSTTASWTGERRETFPREQRETKWRSRSGGTRENNVDWRSEVNPSQVDENDRCDPFETFLVDRLKFTKIKFDSSRRPLFNWKRISKTNRRNWSNFN